MRDIEQTGTEMDKQNTVYHKLVTKNKVLGCRAYNLGEINFQFSEE